MKAFKNITDKFKVGTVKFTENIIKPTASSISKTTDTIMKPATSIISTVRTTSRVAKWSILLISGGIFLFGLAKTVESLNNTFKKKD